MLTLHSRRALDGVLGLVVAFSGATSGSRAVAQQMPSDAEIRSILKTRVDSGLALGIVVGVLQDVEQQTGGIHHERLSYRFAGRRFPFGCGVSTASPFSRLISSRRAMRLVS